MATGPASRLLLVAVCWLENGMILHLCSRLALQNCACWSTTAHWLFLLTFFGFYMFGKFLNEVSTNKMDFFIFV